MIEFLSLLSNIIQIIGVIWGLFVGGETIFEFLKRKSSGKRRMPLYLWINIISLLVIFLFLLLYARPGAGVPEGKISTALISVAKETVPSGGATFNDSLPCTNASCSDFIEITLNQATINTVKHRTTLTFTITNNGSYMLANIQGTLQSAEDASPIGGFKNSLPLGKGNPTLATVEFVYVPFKEIKYTLLITLSSYSSEQNITFDPYFIKFATS